MDYIGMDVGKRESQIAILTADGELSEMRIRTERERLARILGERPKAKILSSKPRPRANGSHGAWKVSGTRSSSQIPTMLPCMPSGVGA